MPPRPAINSRDRPLSAIYIGSPASSSSTAANNGHTSSGLSAAKQLPDLPEPPSPVSSVGSGLPSPPATNSTGSGSTGDPASIALRRPHSPMNAQNTQARTGSSDSSDTRSSSRISWKSEDVNMDLSLDQDEDQTMRLKIASGSSNEQILQRARNLAQRNKIQLDKLASGKLGRASPSSTSSSRNQRYSMPDPPQALSGSETEREGDSSIYNSTSTASSGSKSITSRARLSSEPISPHRARAQANSTTSSTSSPTRRRKRVSLAHISTSSFDEPSDDENEYYDVRLHKDGERYEVGTTRDRIRVRQEPLREDRPSPRAPTVSLNSLRKTPLGGSRRRSALPREFREGSADEGITDEPPQTPFRAATASPLPATNTSSTSTMHSDTLGRRSTLRSTRGLSDDYRSSYPSRDIPSRTRTTPITTDNDSSTATSSTHTPNSAIPNTPASAKSTGTIEYHDNSPTMHARTNTIGRHTAARKERRQTLRGGSAESALGGATARSLVGEGLRAAGLSRRTGVGTPRERERDRERTISTTAAGKQDREQELDRASMVSGSSNPSRRGDSAVDVPLVSPSPDVFKGEERRVDWSPESTESLTRRQQRRLALDPSEFSSRALPPRASTSMADYGYASRARRPRVSVQHSDSEDDRDHDDEGDDDDNGKRDGRKELRPYKSAYGVLSSREASLTRREQTLVERERELGRRVRELDRERAGSVLGKHHTGSSVNIATPAPTPNPYASFAMRERERDRSTRRTPGPRSQQQNSGHSHQPSQTQSEHTKLMVDSLTMFESQLLKLAPVLGPAGANHAEMLTKHAGTLVVNAERLNTMLKSGNGRALDAQIEAEVEGDYGSGSETRDSLVDVWRKIGGEYREGLRVSDDLVRALTGLLLGVGRVLKEYVHTQYGSEAGSVHGGTPKGSPVVHGRSISLGEEELRLRGGVKGAGGGVSPDFGRETRRSWEPGMSGVERGGGSSNASTSTGAGSREEALRRLAGVRSDSPLARASPAFHAVRELDRLETASPAIGASGLGLPRVNIPRRLFAPSQQREMALVAENGQQAVGYDPSPTPASRTRAFDRAELTVPAILSQQQFQHSPLQQMQEIPFERRKTLTLPSQAHTLETPLRRNISISPGGNGDNSEKAISSRDRPERRKISIASIATIRGAPSNTGSAASGDNAAPSSAVSVPVGFSTLPSGATTAVTLDGGISSAMSITRTTSNNSGSSLYSLSTKPTFSRPEGISGLQQQLEGYRKRAEHDSVQEAASGVSEMSLGGGEAGKGRSRNGISMKTPESEREVRRKTYGSRVGARISLDAGGRDAGEFGERGGGAGERPAVDLSVNAADRSAAATISGPSRHERRRTVTDIWPTS